MIRFNFYLQSVLISEHQDQIHPKITGILSTRLFGFQKTTKRRQFPAHAGISSYLLTNSFNGKNIQRWF